MLVIRLRLLLWFSQCAHHLLQELEQELQCSNLKVWVIFSKDAQPGGGRNIWVPVEFFKDSLESCQGLFGLSIDVSFCFFLARNVGVYWTVFNV